MFKSSLLAIVAVSALAPAWADVMAKELTLTADPAAKFWPLSEQYQAEQDAILDAQIKATQKFADSYGKLTNADSLAYVGSLLEADGKAQALRTR